MRGRLIAQFAVKMVVPLPSPNSKLHHFVRARMVRAARAHMAMVARSARVGPVASEKRAVRLTRFYTGREKEMDMDNVLGMMKPCLDALKIDKAPTLKAAAQIGSGWIVDDKQEWLELYPPLQVRTTFRGIGVEVWEFIPDAVEG
jgi:hypothetical protein